MSAADLYDRDFYLWTRRNAELLRAGCLGEADLENIAEEIDSMGASNERQLENRLSVLMMHLLKWLMQPERRSNSWGRTMNEQRASIKRLLEKNPSLRPNMDEAVAYAYGRARRRASLESNIDRARFPTECPFLLDQVLDPEYFPEGL